MEEFDGHMLHMEAEIISRKPIQCCRCSRVLLLCSRVLQLPFILYSTWGEMDGGFRSPIALFLVYRCEKKLFKLLVSLNFPTSLMSLLWQKQTQLVKYIFDGLIFRLPGDSLVFGKWSVKNIMSQHKEMFVSMYMRTANYCIILKVLFLLQWRGRGQETAFHEHYHCLWQASL